MQHVVLVPGFFGFDQLGELSYFHGVTELLADQLRQRGVEAQVTALKTMPTASIRHRAARLLDTLAEIVRSDDDVIHLVGHSTGGLDARLAICPTADLPTKREYQPYTHTRSLVCIATPHYGTPLARLFGGAMGQPALRLAGLVTAAMITHAKLPVRGVLLAGSWVTRLDDVLGLKNTIGDQVFEALLKDGKLREREELLEFLEGISSDQSLVFQLTESGCDLLNASTGDPDGVSYASVLTRAPRPKLAQVLEHKHDLYAQTAMAGYAFLHLFASRTNPHWLPSVSKPEREHIASELGDMPSLRDNDGIVPTWSQVWGRVLCATRADHLDVVGHYGDDTTSPASADWFPSGSRFGKEEFARVWGAVADHVAEAA